MGFLSWHMPQVGPLNGCLLLQGSTIILAYFGKACNLTNCHSLTCVQGNGPERQVKEGGVENRDSPQIMKRKKPIEKKPVEDK